MTDERPPALRGEVQEPGRGSRPGAFRFQARTWTWDDRDIRRGLPWIGVFLVVFGGILLLGQAYPQAHILGSALTTAFGIALLVSWATPNAVVTAEPRICACG